MVSARTVLPYREQNVVHYGRSPLLLSATPPPVYAADTTRQLESIRNVCGIRRVNPDFGSDGSLNQRHPTDRSG